jgi:hypothetical protein
LRAIIEKKLPPNVLNKYDGVLAYHLIWDGKDHGTLGFQANSKSINWRLVAELLEKTKIWKRNLGSGSNQK